MRARGVRSLVRDCEANLTDEKRLPSGKYYRDCSELEKAQLDSLLDAARIVERTMDSGRRLNEGEKDYIVFALFESTLLNREASAPLSEKETKLLHVGAIEILRKFEPVLGRRYLESKIRGIQLLDAQAPL